MRLELNHEAAVIHQCFKIPQNIGNGILGMEMFLKAVFEISILQTGCEK